MSNNPKIAEYDYTVRADGRRTDLLERFFTSGGVTENSYSWSYDALNRLTSETIDSSNNALDRTTSWTFDLTGNRLNQIVDVGNRGVQKLCTGSARQSADWKNELIAGRCQGAPDKYEVGGPAAALGVWMRSTRGTRLASLVGWAIPIPIARMPPRGSRCMERAAATLRTSVFGHQITRVNRRFMRET